MSVFWWLNRPVDDSALGVRCPSCPAVVGQRCTDYDGLEVIRRKRPHPTREVLAVRRRPNPVPVPVDEGERVYIARCPEHGLHGCRDTCFECGGPVEQVAFVPADGLRADRPPAENKPAGGES